MSRSAVPAAATPNAAKTISIDLDRSQCIEAATCPQHCPIRIASKTNRLPRLNAATFDAAARKLCPPFCVITNVISQLWRIHRCGSAGERAVKCDPLTRLIAEMLRRSPTPISSTVMCWIRLTALTVQPSRLYLRASFAVIAAERLQNVHNRTLPTAAKCSTTPCPAHRWNVANERLAAHKSNARNLTRKMWNLKSMPYFGRCRPSWWPAARALRSKRSFPHQTLNDFAQSQIQVRSEMYNYFHFQLAKILL